MGLRSGRVVLLPLDAGPRIRHLDWKRPFIRTHSDRLLPDGRVLNRR